MPQLAPINWLFLFFLFWFVVGLSSTLIWWSFKAEYKISDADNSGKKLISKSLKPWSW